MFLNYLNIFLLIFSCFVFWCHCNQESPYWLEELFGDGLSEKTLAEKSRKHLASSTEDLQILLETEERLLKILRNDTSDLVKSYIKNVDHLDADDLETYVLHPINAFHLMKRASNFWPRLKKLLQESNHELISGNNEIIFPEKTDFLKGASFGLVNLQIMHQLNTSEMIRGILRNPVDGKVFQARQNLTSDEALLLASTAKNVFRLNSQVTWLETALEAAIAEQRSETQQGKIKKLIKRGRRDHDDSIFNKGFLRRIPGGEFLFTNKKTFDKELMKTHNLRVHLRELDEVIEEMQPFKNLHGTTDLPFKLGYTTDYYNQKLCSGEKIRPPEMDKDLKCFYLHYKNPYLRLGPFKYEPLNAVPHVGQIVDFASPEELSLIRERARGHMKSTPLRTNNQVEDYTRHRTSKVMYLNELQTNSTRSWSDRIDLATKFQTYAERWGSENYQVMNYGIGGSIVGHLDSTGIQTEQDEHKQEHIKYGGPRFCTFMIYLSEVEAGGRTVFPTIGVSVPPVAGSALFWMNLDSGGTLDSRNFHLGCPVVYGNKWIANKWVHWIPQMWNYPCYVNKEPFPVYSN